MLQAHVTLVNVDAANCHMVWNHNYLHADFADEVSFQVLRAMEKRRRRRHASRLSCIVARGKLAVEPAFGKQFPCRFKWAADCKSGCDLTALICSDIAGIRTAASEH